MQMSRAPKSYAGSRPHVAQVGLSRRGFRSKSPSGSQLPCFSPSASCLMQRPNDAPLATWRRWTMASAWQPDHSQSGVGDARSTSGSDVGARCSSGPCFWPLLLALQNGCRYAGKTRAYFAVFASASRCYDTRGGGSALVAYPGVDSHPVPPAMAHLARRNVRRAVHDSPFG